MQLIIINKPAFSGYHTGYPQMNMEHDIVPPTQLTKGGKYLFGNNMDCLIHGKLFPKRYLYHVALCICCSQSHWLSLDNQCVMVEFIVLYFHKQLLKQYTLVTKDCMQEEQFSCHCRWVCTKYR